MKVLFVFTVFLLAFSRCVLGQDPMPVIDFNWVRTRQQAPKQDTPGFTPARAVTNDNKYFQRKAREAQTNVTVDPNETTIDGRSAAMDKAVNEARAAKPDSLDGYLYTANVKNDSGKTVNVVFWEYRFVELANPENVVRRQFLCSVNAKNGSKLQLSSFSILGPSEVISTESLAKTDAKLFDEKVLINRIEFSDGTLRQRGNWKYEDVVKTVEKVTATPWGKEICRAL